MESVFENLVRIHREGEHFEGIKPAGTPVEPGVIAADEAIKVGSVDHLVGEIKGRITPFQESPAVMMNGDMQPGQAWRSPDGMGAIHDRRESL